jgi:hypothetical protein
MTEIDEMSRADALAHLSEGFCPFCGTAFWLEDDGVYRCGKGATPDGVRAEIDDRWPVEEEVAR